MDSTKTLCVMGLFDPEANLAFSGLGSRMAQHGVPGADQQPHLTFGIYDNLNREDLLNWVAQIAQTQKKLTLNFNHIGLFQQGICFAEPCANLELLCLHRILHAKYDQDCRDRNCLYSLKSKSWVPHTTLAVWSPEQISDFMPAVLESFRPIQATITQLAITESPPLRQICEFPLQSR